MTGWQDLARECDAWAAAGSTVELWWRDDDAIADTPALRRLLALARGRAPVALAVIPGTLTPSLAPLLDLEGKTVSVLQHGYDHGNRAPADAKKSEFPATRPAAEVTQVLAAGRDRLHDRFAARFVPAFTPPWNRFDPRHLSLLPDLGYRGLTAYLARKNKLAAPGVRQVNTHVDVINWHGTFGFLGLEPILELLVGHLAAKREGRADAAEPTGLLTHHLVHDRERGNSWRLSWIGARAGRASGGAERLNCSQRLTHK